MSRQTEAIHPASWSERLLVLAFLACAVWCGQRLGKVYSVQVVEIKKKDIERGYVGSEWNEIRVFEQTPSLEGWEAHQRALTGQVQRYVNETLDFGYVVSYFPPVLNQMDQFEDYTLRPALPLGGTVIQLERGPRCLDFIWTEIPVPGVHYTLEVARTREFKFFRTFGASGNSIRIQANKKGDYFWRVRANLNRANTVSELSSFFVLEPEMTSEERRLKEVAARINNPTAWLSDLQFCR